jgi:alpha-tubulin suppressor-like RCC1 family protein
MRRLLTGFILFVGVTLLLVWNFKSGVSVRSSGFSVGPPLPPGKVTPQLVSTWDEAVLLAPDGSLWGWGGSQLKQSWLQPNPGGRGIPRPQRIGAGSDWQKVSADFTHALALKRDGSLWGWGNNNSGQLAQPRTTNYALKQVQIGIETNWAEISVGAGHSLALKQDGSLWAWGQNESGQVGDGTTSNKYVPIRISPDLGWKSIAAGAFNGYALKNDGTIWGWGLDVMNGSRAKINVLAPARIDAGTNWSFISASDFVLMALKSDGTLWIRGQNALSVTGYYVKSPTTNFTQIGTDTDWQDVYTGQNNFFARKRDGSWWICGGAGWGSWPSFGLRAAGKVHRVPLDFEPWAFADGSGNSLLLTKDGTLWSWGERLGWQQSSLRQNVAAQWNRLRGLFSRRPRPVAGPLKVIDAQPYRLWELPADMRRALGTNSVPDDQRLPSETKLGH